MSGHEYRFGKRCKPLKIKGRYKRQFTQESDDKVYRTSKSKLKEVMKYK